MTKIYDIVSLSHNELLNSTWSLVSIYIYVYIYIYIWKMIAESQSKWYFSQIWNYMYIKQQPLHMYPL